MKILFAASEAHPLIKTGGLADVAGSLPKALHELGHDIRMVLPGYPKCLDSAENLQQIASFTLPGTHKPTEIYQGTMPDSDVIVYLVRYDDFFNRDGNPYLTPNGQDWPDNAARFTLFCQAAVDIAMGLMGTDWQADLVHCNDWQTGLIPALLKQHHGAPKSLFTIHNLAYQGLFDWDTFDALSVPKSLWTHTGMEFHDQFSFIKGGLVYADWLNTVSPTYAKEICTEEYGCGLEGLLSYRASQLTGILNGIDYSVWDPSTDSLIEANYGIGTLQNKAINKRALQREMGLSEDPSAFLLGHVGRLVAQKGADLIVDMLDGLFQYPVQVAILGSGDTQYEEQLRLASARYPDKLAIHVGYDEGLAHRIEAGADSFLMPSRYEPCGLNQIYSLRYGTVPIVRETGGLADSVVNSTITNIQNRTATGFHFTKPTADALLKITERAIAMRKYRLKYWWRLALTGMQQDFSWTQSAKTYQELYFHICTTEETLKGKTET